MRHFPLLPISAEVADEVCISGTANVTQVLPIPCALVSLISLFDDLLNAEIGPIIMVDASYRQFIDAPTTQGQVLRYILLHLPAPANYRTIHRPLPYRCTYVELH